MENAPAGTLVNDPHARRPRAPAIDLAKHDVAVREAENAPQVLLFETGGDPMAPRNKPVWEMLNPDEMRVATDALEALGIIWRRARERFNFKTGQWKMAEQAAQTQAADEAAEAPQPPQEATEGAKPAAKPKGKAKAATKPPAPAPAREPVKPLVDEEEDFDANLDESKMNAAFAAALHPEK